MFESTISIDQGERVSGLCTFEQVKPGSFFIDLNEQGFLWMKLSCPVKTESVATRWSNCVRIQDGLFGFKVDSTRVQVRDASIVHAAPK